MANGRFQGEMLILCGDSADSAFSDQDGEVTDKGNIKDCPYILEEVIRKWKKNLQVCVQNQPYKMEPLCIIVLASAGSGKCKFVYKFCFILRIQIEPTFLPLYHSTTCQEIEALLALSQCMDCYSFHQAFAQIDCKKQFTRSLLKYNNTFLPFSRLQ
jgi:hypothetical protein